MSNDKGVYNYQNQPQVGFQQVPAQPPSYEQTYPTTSQPQPVRVTQIITTAPVGPNPMATRCPSCHEQIVTRTDYEASTKTHLFAALICLIFWPCVWIPYVTDSCKSANHYCPNCGAFIGAYSG